MLRGSKRQICQSNDFYQEFLDQARKLTRITWIFLSPIGIKAEGFCYIIAIGLGSEKLLQPINLYNTNSKIVCNLRLQSISCWKPCKANLNEYFTFHRLKAKYSPYIVAASLYQFHEPNSRLGGDFSNYRMWIISVRKPSKVNCVPRVSNMKMPLHTL